MAEPVALLRVGEEPPPVETPAADSARSRRTRPTTATVETTNRFAVINAFVDHSLRKLTGAEAAVWFILWRETRTPGVARIAQDVIADRAGVNVRTVRRALERLKTLGLVEVVNTGNLYHGPSSYRAYPLAHREEQDASVR